MRRVGRIALFAVLLVAAGVAVWEVAPQTGSGQGAGGTGGGDRPSRRGGGGRRGGGSDGPIPVLTSPSAQQDVPVTLDAVGTVQALNAVTVRSQVDGRLMKLEFQEGQDVARGDVIARIEPTIYQAQYDQAVAKKAQDEANVANARIDLQRYVSLAATNAGSKQQADTQRAMVAQLEAQLQSDQGAIDNARAYLDWTTIRAPLDGRTGIRLVDQGNLVRASDATGIVSITQLRPITVLFNLPQQNLRAVTGASARGTVPVEALESDNATVLDRGTLAVVDNQVDQATGTVKLKGTFPNPNLQLWPGAFVNVRLTVDTIRGATTVPTAAIQRGPNGTFVYLVADGKAVLRPVTIGLQTEILTVVTAGVSAPERVITTGFARLTDGEAVEVSDPAPASADAAASPAPGRRGGEGGRRRRAQEGGEVASDGRPGAHERGPGNRRAGDRRPGEGRADAPPPATGAAPPATDRPAGTGSTGR